MSAAREQIPEIVEGAEMVRLDFQDREVGVPGIVITAGGLELFGLLEEGVGVVGHGWRLGRHGRCPSTTGLGPYARDDPGTHDTEVVARKGAVRVT